MKKYDLAKTTYDEYLQQQATRARAKFYSTYRVRQNQIERQIRKAIELKPEIEYIENVICMGIRGGNEYTVFKAIFHKWEVWGVDICEMVEKIGKNCFAYDFNNLPKEWESKFDLVYSNSLDHSYDIKETLKEWERVCKKYMLLNLSTDGSVSHTDIYSFEEKDINKLFKNFKVLGTWKDDKEVLTKTFNVLLEKND